MFIGYRVSMGNLFRSMVGMVLAGMVWGASSAHAEEYGGGI